MSEHKVTTLWRRTSADFTYKNYNRAHEWHFEGGVVTPASAAAEYLGDPDLVDPEQAFTAALSSCHMLTFLAVASQQRYTVDSYIDEAVGVLGKNESGKMMVTEVILKPKIVFSGDKIPDAAQLEKLHELAHEHCFLANSVLTKVTVV